MLNLISDLDLSSKKKKASNAENRVVATTFSRGCENGAADRIKISFAAKKFKLE